MLGLKGLFLLSLLLLGVWGLVKSSQSLRPEHVYRKDFIQDYLAGKAVLAGLDPYLPTRELAEGLHLTANHPIHLLHPTPHPPPFVAGSIPLGLLTYPQAAAFWFLLEISCLLLTAYLLLGWLPARRTPLRVALLFLLMMAWTPFEDEMIIGQLMTPLLVLFLGAWLALRRGKNLAAGIFLGSAMAIKLIAWPLVLFLALRQRWRAALTSVAVWVLANLAAAWPLGFESLAHYYRKVGPAVSALNRAQEKNLSLWSLGWRLFEGTGSSVLAGVHAPPVLYAPELARWGSLALCLAVLVIGLRPAVRGRNFDLGFALLVCLSILVSPIAWSYYLVLLAIPLAVAGRCLSALDWPLRETILFLVLVLAMAIPHSTLHRFLLILARQPVAELAPGVSWEISLLSLIPTGCLAALIYLLWRLQAKSLALPENL